MLPRAIRPGHVAVQHDDTDQRILLGKIEGVPAGRQSPSCGTSVQSATGTAIFQLRLHLVHFGRKRLVVVIAEHRISGTSESFDRVHKLELLYPSWRGSSTGEIAIPAVTQHEECVGMKTARSSVAFHTASDHLLRLKAAAIPRDLGRLLLGPSPAPNHERVCCFRIKRPSRIASQSRNRCESTPSDAFPQETAPRQRRRYSHLTHLCRVRQSS